MMTRTSTLASALTLLSALASVATGANEQFEIQVLSGRADMVSGGDALVRIRLPDGLSPDRVTVELNGVDATSAFRPGPAGALTGLVTGLELGDNAVRVSSRDGGRNAPGARLSLKNYPASGPIFSGPQEQPFICQTQAFQLPDGSSLGEALDRACSVETVVTYVYKSSETSEGSRDSGRDRSRAWKPLPSRTSLPADVAWTSTSTGERVPYVVRVETGTVNRSIYQFALLHDPTTGAESGPMQPPPAWNRRLLYTFGGGCPRGWFTQGSRLGSGGVLHDDIVGRGYAEASSTLNVAGINCNDTVSAETMMMVKERFIESYGPPLFTFSRGGSGGSYQQNQIVDNYPGLLDGILPSLNYPDVQALTQMLVDSRLLTRYYDRVGDALTTEQKRAIAGVVQLENVYNAQPLAGRINPTEFCPEELPEALRYDAKTNPTGARCDVYDHNINLYGRDPATGFARRPIDNTGVQYGLAALNDGTISVAQFLDLNRRIGGYDENGYLSDRRAVADPLALRGAYENGLITNGGKGLGKLPILEVRSYRDLTPKGEHHLKYHSFAYRERLRVANGSSENHVLFVADRSTSDPVDDLALSLMDRWLTALVQDESDDPEAVKIARAKPAEAVDSCWTRSGERITEPQTFDGGKCNELYPTASWPRRVTGGPLTNDVLKCRLKPIDSSDYRVPVTAQEMSKLKEIFPTGVCDWTQPGVEQPSKLATWRMH